MKVGRTRRIMLQEQVDESRHVHSFKKCPKSLRVDSSCNINSIALQNTD